jgi:hypothetical protein
MNSDARRDIWPADFDIAGRACHNLQHIAAADKFRDKSPSNTKIPKTKL